MALGALSILNCTPVGQELKRGEMIFEGAYGNKTVKFLSPINGTVKSVNENIFGKKSPIHMKHGEFKLLQRISLMTRRAFYQGQKHPTG